MPKPPRARTVRFEVNLTKEEEKMLDALAKKQGVNRAVVVRQLIRAAAVWAQ